MSQNQVTNTSVFIFKWMYIKWMYIKWMYIKWMTFYISSPRHLFYPDAFPCLSLSCVFAWLSRYSGENLMFFVCNSTLSYSLSFVCKSCLRCLVKDLPVINSIYRPRKILHLPPPLKRMFHI